MERSGHRFACAINCMDGRVQDPVKIFLRNRFNVDFVDMVTEKGPNKILAENRNHNKVENIRDRVKTSVIGHGSQVVAIVGHFGCAGNPAKKEEQIKQLLKAKKTVESFHFAVKVILLWVGSDFSVAEEVIG